MMLRIVLAVAGLMVLGLLAGCATLSKAQCEAGDWQGVGLIDGENGAPLSRFLEHVDACGEHGIVPDRSLYEAGREEGLKRYCTVSRAEQEGLAGRAYHDVCEGEVGLSFRRVYRQAGDVRDVRQQIEAEENDLDRLIDQLAGEELTEEERLRLTQSISLTQAKIAILELNRVREEAELRAVINEESSRLARL